MPGDMAPVSGGVESSSYQPPVPHLARTPHPHACVPSMTSRPPYHRMLFCGGGCVWMDVMNATHPHHHHAAHHTTQSRNPTTPTRDVTHVIMAR